jgi:heme-degrading monooxygenase HmoA
VPLHATVFRYDGVTGPIDEVVHAGNHLASALSQAPGFVTCALLDAGRGVLVSISVFEDRADMEAADRLVGKAVAERLASLLPHPTEVVAGEVIVQRGM